MYKFLTWNTVSKQNSGTGSSKIQSCKRNSKKQAETVRTNFVKTLEKAKVYNQLKAELRKIQLKNNG